MPLKHVPVIVALTIIGLASNIPVAYASGSLCYNLWEERNDIYASAGYCFKTQLAIDRFGNADCKYNDIKDVPLSVNNLKDIQGIVQQERKLGCHM